MINNDLFGIDVSKKAIDFEEDLQKSSTKVRWKDGKSNEFEDDIFEEQYVDEIASVETPGVHSEIDTNVNRVAPDFESNELSIENDGKEF